MAKKLAIAFALLSAFPSTARAGTFLVSSDGRPTGGMWQSFVDKSLEPTYSGQVQLDLTQGDQCITAFVHDGCAWITGFTRGGSVSSFMPEMAIDGAGIPVDLSYQRASKMDLFYQLGHLFDYEYLDDPSRSTFARIWGVPVPKGVSPIMWWWAFEFGKEPSQALVEWFAYDYMLCATGTRVPPTIDLPVFAYGLSRHRIGEMQNKSCAFIRQMGATS